MATLKEIRTALEGNSLTSGLSITKTYGKDSGDMRSKTIIRQGFFYTNGNTSQMLADKVSRVLTESNLTFKVVDHGEVWKDFKGGAPVAKQSHWWVIID